MPANLKQPTVKECAERTGYSLSSMKRLHCMWCDQSMLNGLRGGCGAIYEKCDPWEKLKDAKAKAQARREAKR